MNLSEYREEIKLKLTGNMLELELDDGTINQFIKSALRELNKYITSTRLITIPYRQCIDLSNSEHTNNEQINVNSVVMIYRTADSVSNASGGSSSSFDPLQVAQWQIYHGMGNLNYFQDAVYNYASWSTLSQIRNTLSTDLSYTFDEHSKRLYINTSTGTPKTITIEYIPKFDDVSEVTSSYWSDILLRLALALIKTSIGLIRSRYTQSNALWQQDGEQMRSEGQQELTEIRELLLNNSELCYPID